MSISIKSPAEIEKMRIAGKLAASVLDFITPHVVVGISTEELDILCHDFIVNELGAIPAPLHYGSPPFPKSICTSINNVVCHGIPSNKKLKKGDILNIDITVIKDGYHGDTSKMFILDNASVRAKRISNIAREALIVGINAVENGKSFSVIGKAITQFAQTKKVSVVRDYCGHGIGSNFHELPQVVHYDDGKKHPIITAGMCFTIEPMINLGSWQVNLSQKDYWTVTTKDRSLSAQWEHTLLTTKDGVEVLTLREEETDLKKALGIV